MPKPSFRQVWSYDSDAVRSLFKVDGIKDLKIIYTVYIQREPFAEEQIDRDLLGMLLKPSSS